MSNLLTPAMEAKLREAGAVPREQDLYSGAGSGFYERLVGNDRAEVREMLALARRARGPILDIAAGSGRLTIPLLRSGNRVTAIDLSDDMLAHLRRAAPDRSLLHCVVADMRDFSLAQRFALVILGATSITLLDRAGRALLYENVRRHLAQHGVFALTVAGGASAEEIAMSGDHEIRVPGPDGEEVYLFSQQIDAAGAARVVNWARASDIGDGREVTVFTSRLRLLSDELLSKELIDAGFAAPVVSAVRASRGEDILLLTTSRAPGSNHEDDHD
ncbi:daptide-type RiPP biosynthesis methyltransferase [Microbacterium sp. UFMG61]|uniref:daptide-type RiPP biosynthesis methyltransferase n=1 Tax=Microbacterium sp. UFMG61 TaxID=2745935 RepID=UPI0018904629|nr:daptide-type RiPP biosynthesis methyltransferase [Microbacterium sp. UFMG61]